MKLIVFCVSAFLFNVCSALPIGTTIDDKTVVIIGSLAFIAVGAVVGACALCHRRKRNFEKFENEGNIPEPQATQYPIFRALSAQDNRISTAIVPDSPPNLSKDNLLNHESDNFPVLSANLEKCQSEHIISIGGNEMEKVINTTNIGSFNDDSQITMISEIKIKPIEIPIINEINTKTHIPSPITPDNDDVRSLSSVTIEIPGDYAEEQDGQAEITLNQCTNPFVEEIERSFMADKNNASNLNPFISDFQNNVIGNGDTASNSSEKLQFVEDMNIVGGYGTFVNNQNSSTSHANDVGSVEEALRALDIAIGCDDEDDDMLDEEISDTIEDTDELTLDANSPSFEHMIKSFLIFSGSNNPVDSLQTTETNIANNDIVVNIDDVKLEATKLVDSVLNDCLNIIEHRIFKDESVESIIYADTLKRNENNTSPIQPVVVSAACKMPENTEFEDFTYNMITSTPCIKIKNMEEIRANVNVNKELFNENDSGILSETNAVNNETYQIGEPKLDVTEKADDADDKQSRNINKNKASPVIKIDKDELNSEDLSTVTPVNTPCELNYNNDTWDKMVNNDGNQLFTYDNEQPSTSAAASTSWFLHPQTRAKSDEKANEIISNDTFKVEDATNVNELTYTAAEAVENDYEDDDDYDYNNDNEGDEDMSIAYEQLRKQLTVMLPHAQGNVVGPLEYSDEEDSNDKTYEDSKSSQDLCINKNNNLDEGLSLICALAGNSSSAGTEIFINYKRTLSPIMEESEDETCKTFVYNNETRCLDSTSTGCMESEAIMMGVAKNLMASNDTLFNFEDTLDDNLFSPRTIKTPTNNIEISSNAENYDSGVGIPSITEQFLSKSCSMESVEPIRNITERPNELSLKEMSSGSSFSNTLDLSSPDQPDQQSLDLDLTFTIDEKTCIFIKNEEERISETSEPDLVSESSTFDFENRDLCNSLLDDDIVSLDEDSINEIIDNQLIADEQVAQIPTEMVNEASEHDEISSEMIVATEVLLEKANVIECVEDLDIVQNKTFTCIANSEEDTHLQELNEEQSLPIDKIEATITTSLNEDCDSSVINAKVVTQNNIPEIMLENEYIDSLETSTEHLDKEFISTSANECVKSECVAVLEGKSDFNSEIPEDVLPIFVSSNYKSLTEKISDLMDKSGKENVDSSDEKLKDKMPSESVLNTKNLEGTPLAEIENNTISVSKVDQEQNSANDTEVNFLSGEEDPWVSDIRLSSTGHDMMTTSFTMPEWDSDADDDSNSSEEFMYVKGRNQQDENQLNTKEGNLEDEITKGVWTTHKDRVPVNSNNDVIKEESEDSSSDAEEEFVPSSWDSMAMPARSALKSPDKTNENKKRQSVAFKKQRYHSVYEYPREIPELSPAYSEPQLWDRHFDEFRIQMEQYTQDIDGFTISSSTRPFHGSQFHAQCNTWPTDSDFSWSQIEENNSLNQNDLNSKLSSDMAIEWPKRSNTFDSGDNDFGRPDSGVGESAELLSESLSLGDLCHTKGTLTLPLDIIAANTKFDLDANNSNDELDNNINNVFDDSILPTPSCTGSMDSLSSSSGSDRPISFTTFGKKETHIYHANDDNDIKTAIVLIEDNTKNILLNNCRNTIVRLSDSTDEDSGIENLSRLTK